MRLELNFLLFQTFKLKRFKQLFFKRYPVWKHRVRHLPMVKTWPGRGNLWSINSYGWNFCTSSISTRKKRSRKKINTVVSYHGTVRRESEIIRFRGETRVKIAFPLISTRNYLWKICARERFAMLHDFCANPPPPA